MKDISSLYNYLYWIIYNISDLEQSEHVPVVFIQILK